MSKNVTLRMDDNVARRACLLATDENTSLSRWAAAAITGAVSAAEEHHPKKGRSLVLLRNALRASNRPLARRHALSS